MRSFATTLAGLVFLLLACASEAAEIDIVALGASNTYGSGRGQTNGGVPSSQAWPAQLQALLRARGVEAHVSNAGVPGDTTAGMQARLRSAVPAGTSLVILQPGGNDARQGAGGARAGNVAAIKRELSARHVGVIVLDRLGQIAPRNTRDPDGQHFNARGHAAIAAYLLPKVMAAVRR